MPCFRCDARQTDPTRGDSPWKRGVVRGEQVLVCPDCQQGSGWDDGLDRCARCGSTRLVKALGAVACRACGLERWPEPEALAAEPGAEAGAGTEEDSGTGVGAPAARPDLAAEVSAALERVLRKAALPSR